MAASNTSQPPTITTNETERALPHSGTTKKDNKNNVEKTFTPITDFLVAVAEAAKSKTGARGSTTATTTKTTAISPNKTTTTTTTTPHISTSKIPYPHPLTRLLPLPKHSESGGNNQFRRCGSLRVRGSKSNIFFDNLESDYYRMEQAENDNTSSPSATRTGQMNAMAKDPQDTHNASNATLSKTGGHASTRRKLVLNAHLPAVGLTRSLSLRRNHTNTSNKTDKSKQQQTCGAAATEQSPSKATDTDSPTKQREQEAHILNGATNGDGECEKASTNSMDVIEARKSPRDVQKMSLNLNGATTTTTASISPVAAGNGTTSTPKTPKTPTSASSTNNKHSHQHCVKSSPLSSVPEKKLTPKTPPVTPDSPCTYLDDDLESIYSFATTTSGRSTMSCEHPYVARNGTTFSGRKMKYVVHCSNHAGQVGSDYLTPTQRAQRQIRLLKALLSRAQQNLEQKDSEILRLTREVVELRIFKASLSSPEERSASSDAVTVREAELKTSQDVSPIVDMVDEGTSKSSPRHIPNAGASHHHSSHHHLQSHGLSSEMQSSFADSGHFEDLSVHSKDSYAAHTHDIGCGSDEGAASSSAAASGSSYDLQRQELIRMYELKIEELIRNQDASSSEMKRSHNDKVEALLQKLAECNTRYADIVPDYEHAKERIRELEKQLEDLQSKLAEHEEKQKKMYLHMYQKGQEAERIARADQALELAHQAPNKVSINELLHQLQSTQDELENIRAAECRINECGSNHALLTAKEAISLWVLGARKTIYRRLLEAQKNRTHVDPEVTLQFLKSAIYYFLTDKENSQGHLQAIESILEFTEAEKLNINKARIPK